MERCPVCRARLAAPTCRRCGADFSQAEAVALQAQQTVQHAISLWQRGYTETAAQLLQHSLSDKQDVTVERLLDCALQQLLQQAVQCLAQDNPQQATCLCARILSIKYLPLAAALQAFIQDGVGEHAS